MASSDRSQESEGSEGLGKHTREGSEPQGVQQSCGPFGHLRDLLITCNPARQYPDICSEGDCPTIMTPSAPDDFEGETAEDLIVYLEKQYSGKLR